VGWLDFFKKSKAKKAEEKELKWILLEFYRLKLIHSSLKNAKKDPKNAKEQITKAFKLLRNEEKIERRLAKLLTQGIDIRKKDVRITEEIKCSDEIYNFAHGDFFIDKVKSIELIKLKKENTKIQVAQVKPVQTSA